MRRTQFDPARVDLLPLVIRTRVFWPILLYFLRTTRGARNPNLQVVITHASLVCSQHSFWFPLRINGMHRTQFDPARVDLLPLVIWTRVFWPSISWNLREAPRWSKRSLWTGLWSSGELGRGKSLSLPFPCYFFPPTESIFTGWSKSVWTFDHCRAHSLTFGYY